MVTLKELARIKGVTYESVRRMVAKYAADLAGHIVTREDGARLLDPEAVAFLTERRRINNVVIAKAEDTGEELDAMRERMAILQKQLDAARAEIVALQSARISDQERIITLQEEVTARIEDKAARAAAEDKAADLQKQLDSFVPSWFGFYRKHTL